MRRDPWIGIMGYSNNFKLQVELVVKLLQLLCKSTILSSRRVQTSLETRMPSSRHWWVLHPLICSDLEVRNLKDGSHNGLTVFAI
jgi:hypothetical protein